MDDISRYAALVTKIVRQVQSRFRLSYSEFDDLRQIGLIAVWKALGKYDQSKASETHYVYQAIRNNVTAYVMRTILNRPKTVELDHLDPAVIIQMDRDYLEDQEHVQFLLSQLEESERELVILVSRTNFVEAGKVLGVHRNQVSRRFRQAIERLSYV